VSRERHADLKLRVVITPVESSHGCGADQLDKPRWSQPESGMRFTSQTGRHHHETLGHMRPKSRKLIQVGGFIDHQPGIGRDDITPPRTGSPVSKTPTRAYRRGQQLRRYGLIIVEVQEPAAPTAEGLVAELVIGKVGAMIGAPVCELEPIAVGPDLLPYNIPPGVPA